MEITTNDIEIYFGESHILKGIDINVSNKEFIGIIGPNGSGKSTLLKCIYRILKPSSGIVKIDTKSINKLTMKETAKKMAVVAQHNYHNFDFSVQDMVLMGRTPHKKALERDNEDDYKIMYNALEKVGMRDFAKRNFNNLSGGEQQRIILARALAQETEALILDEPTNHLDIKYQLQLLDIVKSLNIEVVSAIHDLNIAAMYCDKIYVMKNGEIVAYGTPREILTENLIKDVYEVEARVNLDEETGELNIIYRPNYKKTKGIS